MRDILPMDMHQDRLLACFRTLGAGGLPPGLMTDQRFIGRLVVVVRQHYELDPSDDGIGMPEDRALASLPRDQLEQFGMRAGVVLRAREFLKEIRGPVLASLAQRFGAEALQDIRQHGDLSADRGNLADMDTLEAAVKLDGEACLAAWIARLPKPLAQRVRLKWPDDHGVPTTGDAEIIRLGPAILRRLASSAGDR